MRVPTANLDPSVLETQLAGPYTSPPFGHQLMDPLRDELGDTSPLFGSTSSPLWWDVLGGLGGLGGFSDFSDDYRTAQLAL